MDDERDREGLAWQTGVWDRMSDIYLREIDRRFVPVVENVLARARLQPGERVLDLGTGTGSVAERAAAAVGPGGAVVGVDLSAEMLALARQRVAARGLQSVTFREGRAEALPVDDASFDVVLACASSRPPAVSRRPRQLPGVGPGALADPSPLLEQLAAAGLRARVETETLGFDFPDFASAWDVLAGVTTAQLPPQRRQEAKEAALAAMYPEGDGQRHFRNVTQFILGEREAAVG